MSVVEWADTYGGHHWQIFWSSYGKLLWGGFQPLTTEYGSDALISRTISPCVQLALRAKFIQLLEFHRFFSFTSHFGCLPESVPMFTLIKVFCRWSYFCSWMSCYIWFHYWQILWNSYRKLVWMGFEPTTTQFLSEALTDWAITPRVQLALSFNFVHLLQFNGLPNVIFHFSCSSVSKFILIKIFCR